jgi:hypothetical protein
VEDLQDEGRDMKDLQAALEQAAHHIEQEARFKQSQARSRAEDDRVLALLSEAIAIVRKMMQAEPIGEIKNDRGNNPDIVWESYKALLLPTGTMLYAHAAPQAVPVQEPCKGKNCGSVNPRLHSAECFAEHEKTVGHSHGAEELEALLLEIESQCGNGMIPWPIEDAFAAYEKSVAAAPKGAV